tara:strand:- start:1522 stop:2856 length:1335 start_codon:yes stop_codon:yes gene_type:complete
MAMGGYGLQTLGNPISVDGRTLSGDWGALGSAALNSYSTVSEIMMSKKKQKMQEDAIQRQQVQQAANQEATTALLNPAPFQQPAQSSQEVGNVLGGLGMSQGVNQAVGGALGQGQQQYNQEALIEQNTARKAEQAEQISMLINNAPASQVKTVLDQIGIDSETKMKDAVEFSQQYAAAKSPEEQQSLLQRRVEGIYNKGGDPSDSLELFDMPQEQRDQTISMAGAIAAKGLGLADEDKKTTKQLDAAAAYPDDIDAQQRMLRGESPQQKADAAAGIEKKKSDERLEKELRNTVYKSNTDSQKVFGAYERIKASKPNAAGDMAMIFNYMKMLDPGSTVREGEFATAQNATGVPDRIINMYNNITEGERLNPEQRKQFLDQAGSLNNAAQISADKHITEQLDVAKAYNLSPEKILGKSQHEKYQGRQKKEQKKAETNNALRSKYGL